VGSNITTAWNNNAFPNNSTGQTGTDLWTKYTTGNKPGTYTRTGDIWTQDGASDTGEVMSVAALAAYLAGLTSNTADTPNTVPLALAFNTGTSVPNGQFAWGTINTAVKNSGKYVILDLSTSTANGTTANTIEGSSSYYDPSVNDFNIIKDNTYIKGIILPATLTSIESFAFYECSRLTSVTIPGSVTSIGDGAFAKCSGLTVFTVAESSTAYSVQDGILYNKTKTAIISVPGAISGALNLPNTLTSIGSFAFFYTPLGANLSKKVLQTLEQI
jgi:hypothetical protein